MISAPDCEEPFQLINGTVPVKRDTLGAGSSTGCGDRTGSRRGRACREYTLVVLRS